MTATVVLEFPPLQEATQVLAALDGHRQVCVFFAERYGWNSQPSAKKITFGPNSNNCSEFAAMWLRASQRGQLPAPWPSKAAERTWDTQN